MKLNKDQRGQTSVEYILMVAALVAVMSSIFGIVRERFIGDGQCNGANQSLMCRINGIWNADNPMVFKTYRFLN